MKMREGGSSDLHAGYVSVAGITIDAPPRIVLAHVLDMGSWVFDFHFEHVSGEIDGEGDIEHLWPVGAEDLQGTATIAESDRRTVLKTVTVIPEKLWYRINPPKVHDGVNITGVNLILLSEANGKTIVTAIRRKESICATAERCKATQQRVDQNQPIPQLRWTEKVPAAPEGAL